MKEKVFNIKLTGKTVMLIVGGVGITVASYVFGYQKGKRSSKEELHKMATAQEQPQAAAAAAQQPQA